MNEQDKLLAEQYAKEIRASLNSWGGYPVHENSILFLAFAYSMISKVELLVSDDAFNFMNAMKAIEVEPGLYHRYPGCTLREAHDNYVGISYLSSLLDQWSYAEDIVEYGEDHLWNYNDQDPGVYDIKCQRQPGEIALYDIAAGRSPGLFTCTWLAIGLSTASTGVLAWLRADLIKANLHNLGWLKRKMLEIAIDKLNKRWCNDLGKTWTSHFCTYFGEDSPIAKLAVLLKL